MNEILLKAVKFVGGNPLVMLSILILFIIIFIVFGKNKEKRNKGSNYEDM